jgi:hypothetical protein
MKKIALLLAVALGIHWCAYSMERPQSSDSEELSFGEAILSSFIGIQIGGHGLAAIQLYVFNKKIKKIIEKWNLFGESPADLREADFIKRIKAFEADSKKDIHAALHTDLNYISHLLYRLQGREIETFGQFFSDLAIDDNYRLRLMYKIRYLYMGFFCPWLKRISNTLHALENRLETIEHLAFQTV